MQKYRLHHFGICIFKTSFQISRAYFFSMFSSILIRTYRNIVFVQQKVQLSLIPEVLPSYPFLMEQLSKVINICSYSGLMHFADIFCSLKVCFRICLIIIKALAKFTSCCNWTFQAFIITLIFIHDQFKNPHFFHIYAMFYISNDIPLFMVQ